MNGNIPNGMIHVGDFAKVNGMKVEEVVKGIKDGLFVGRVVKDEWYINKSNNTANIAKSKNTAKMAGQTEYNIYNHKTLGYEVIKQGFSWPGFLFTWIWAFTKKLWVPGGILIPVVFIANTLGIALFSGQNQGFQPDRGDSWANLALTSVLIFGPGLLVGIKGNSWRERSMPLRGYDFVGSVIAGTVDAALTKVDEKAVTQMQESEKSYKSEQSIDSKECPMCAETIKAKAKKCRFCGYEFT